MKVQGNAMELRCCRPIRRAVLNSGVVLAGEHSGRVWLWRWPALLLWRQSVEDVLRPQDIAWLGVYGTTTNRCPGDIWGLDEDGNLLLIELKVWPGRRAHNPFSRFVSVAKDSKQFSVDELTDDWRRRLRLEREYAPKARRLLAKGARGTPAPAAGLLPYASRREALHAWPDLYRSLLPWVSSRQYERLVEQRLQRRRTAGSPPPHFVGFIVMHRDQQANIGATWRDSHEALCRAAGPERVHCRAAIARVKSTGDVLIKPVAWSAA